ncbi:hypothetical protein RFI_33250, partial [Reticulomyxa filosa]
MVEGLTCNEWVIDMDVLKTHPICFGCAYIALLGLWLAPTLSWNKDENWWHCQVFILMNGVVLFVHLWLFVCVVFTLSFKRIAPLVANYQLLSNLLTHGNPHVGVHLNSSVDWNEPCLFQMCEYLFRKQSLMFSNIEMGLLFVFIWSVISVFVFVIQSCMLNKTNDIQTVPDYLLIIGCVLLSNGCIIHYVQKCYQLRHL